MREGLLANVAYFLQQYFSYNLKTQFCIFQLLSKKTPTIGQHSNEREDISRNTLLMEMKGAKMQSL